MNIAGLVVDSFRLRNAEQPIQTPTRKAYSTVLPINDKKMEDIKKTIVYIPEDKMNFWNPIFFHGQQQRHPQKEIKNFG